MAKVPAYERIRDAVRIQAQQAGSGAQLPSETQLAARFGVTRVTVRHALAGLEAEGIVVRRQGSGTFVREGPPTPRSLSRLSGFGAELRAQGLDVQTRMLAFEERMADPVVRSALSLDGDTRVVYMARLRIVNGRPLAVQKAWLPLELVPGLLGRVLVNDSLYDTLESRCFLRLRHAEQRISAVAATTELAALLEVPRRSPLLHIERITSEASGRRVELALSWTNPGYQLSAVLDR